ncbi:MAG: hypothetical protein PF961_02005 [Planctomycetota bacterium]|jgi:hypothetical protein|nr:hypothetical protein [Planctomycetota bacterium]
MPEPVIIAVPPKGGSLEDVFERLVQLGWVEAEFVAAIRSLVKQDKKRIKLESQLIRLWHQHGGDAPALEAAEDLGIDVDLAQAALGRMVRYTDIAGKDRIGFTPKSGVDDQLHAWRHDANPVVAEAAMALHLELDLSRYGRPSRVMFDHHEFEFSSPRGSVRGVLVGTDHEVTPTYLRRHQRDISLTCYDAFHNTLLDALDTGKVRNWRELTEHLIEANTDVRILGGLGLDDYLGHFVLMPEAKAKQVQALGASRDWYRDDKDPKMSLLSGEPLLIDANYEGIYRTLLDADANGIDFEHTTQDIEELCANEGRTAIYIVRSGSTIARTPGLYVVGAELVTSETIVAVNQERLEHHPGVDILVESLAPSAEDRAGLWRDKMAARLGEKLI